MSTAAGTTHSVSTWNIDPAHSSAGFKVRHMMISNVKGTFKGLSGVLTLDESEPTRSRVEASIPIAGLSTCDEQRDGHLKSADFLDVEKFPTITFKSTGVKPSGNGGEVTGELTIHGVAQPVTLEVEGPVPEIKDPWGMHRIGGSATAKINRKDFGLTWNSALETGGVLVGDEVKITIEFEAVR